MTLSCVFTRRVSSPLRTWVHSFEYREFSSEVVVGLGWSKTMDDGSCKHSYLWCASKVWVLFKKLQAYVDQFRRRGSGVSLWNVLVPEPKGGARQTLRGQVTCGSS